MTRGCVMFNVYLFQDIRLATSSISFLTLMGGKCEKSIENSRDYVKFIDNWLHIRLLVIFIIYIEFEKCKY